MRIINTYTEFVQPDNPRTAEEIRDLCCTDVPFDPCAKTGRVSDYQGAEKEDWDFDPDQLLEQARADNPGKRILSVRVEGVGNRPGQPCGKKYESWTGKNSCCDFVEPMVWDWENSAEIVAPGNRVAVGFIGGAPPFYVEVRGEGFTLDGYRQRNGWVDTNFFWVYAADFACGWCPITVSDGCSVVSGGVRCTLGQWVLDPYASPCSVPGTGEIEWNSTTESILGKYKVRQSCAGDAVNCAPDQLRECSPAEIITASAWLCANFSGNEPPCFSVPPGATDCGNGLLYWESGPSQNPELPGLRIVRAYIFYNYTVWEWVC